MKRTLVAGMYSSMLAIISLLVLSLTEVPAQAVSVLNSCTTYCHGMPPRDAARKGNPRFGSQSSAFIGNHRNHLSGAPVASDCSICHTPVAPTNFGHQTGVINMANSLKGYSSAALRARYDKGVFFNQTSIPNLSNATCSNVSCHFEKKTPVWGSAAFVAPVDCNACHGAPPSGGAAGAVGSHARHDAYFPGTSNCQKCHPNHVTFIHATSAGSPLQVQGFLRDPLNTLEATGTYTGTGLNYLPSKNASQVFGSCNNIYCHSIGQSVTGVGAGTAVTTPAWGSAALTCGSCHQNMGPAVNANATGKHSKHAQTAGIACSVCHGASYTSSTVPTGAGTTHVDKNINLAFSGVASSPATTYSKGNTFAAGVSVYGNCSNSYCHSTVQNATTGLAGATYRSVSWTTATNLTCAGCHVDMTTDATGSGSHRVHTIATGANFDCAVCHAGYTKTSTVPATHVNGLIELGAAGFTYSQGAAHAPASGYGTCSASVCHGQGAVTWGATFVAGTTFPYSTSQCDKCHAGTTAAPFYSTAIPKVTSNTDAKVGAHTSHLTSTDSLASAFACFDCHGTVTLNSANHMKGTTSFSWSALAQTGGLTPTYSAGSCANVYCHGAGMPGGDTSGTNRTPTWNVPFLPATLTSAACGTCHGFPPSAASGHPAVTIPAGFPTTASIGTTCSCHANINTSGNSYAIIFVNKALHINGTVDVAVGGACDTCHGYPPASVGFTGTQNNWSTARAENYLGGGGAHTIASHISKTAKPGEGFANCTKCHNASDHVMSPVAFNPSSNIKVRVNPRYRLEAAKQFKYSSNRLNATSHVTGTCSNSSCHFGATPKWDPAH
ncbi:MAG: CxxxxCH/CxxCH domain-containing protein [Desulfuromonadales bacterium]|nr:CxxxxCH/CxxCH domain-containing protein [Desulfuromonadales bacterium]